MLLSSRCYRLLQPHEWQKYRTVTPSEEVKLLLQLSGVPAGSKSVSPSPSGATMAVSIIYSSTAPELSSHGVPSSSAASPSGSSGPRIAALLPPHQRPGDGRGILSWLGGRTVRPLKTHSLSLTRDPALDQPMGYTADLLLRLSRGADKRRLNTNGYQEEY